MSQPLIVTGELPGEIFAWADGMRRSHFPVERNNLVAHVTLFHTFAPSLRAELQRMLGRLAGEYARPHARIDGLLDLGKGTALSIRSPAMLEVRKAITAHFHGALTTQDLHEPRLHITIQNKVTREQARALQSALAPALQSRDFAFTGLGLHLYCNPNWETQSIWPFRGKT